MYIIVCMYIYIYICFDSFFLHVFYMTFTFFSHIVYMMFALFVSRIRVLHASSQVFYNCLRVFTCFMRFMSNNFCTSRSDWNFISATSSLDRIAGIPNHNDHSWSWNVLRKFSATEWLVIIVTHSNVFKTIPFTSRQRGWVQNQIDQNWKIRQY